MNVLIRILTICNTVNSLDLGPNVISLESFAYAAARYMIRRNALLHLLH